MVENKITMIPSVWVSTCHAGGATHRTRKYNTVCKINRWLLTSEARLDMRLIGLHRGEFSLSCCSFLRNSGGRRMSMGRDIRLLTSWRGRQRNGSVCLVQAFYVFVNYWIDCQADVQKLVDSELWLRINVSQLQLKEGNLKGLTQTGNSSKGNYLCSY